MNEDGGRVFPEFRCAGWDGLQRKMVLLTDGALIHKILDDTYRDAVTRESLTEGEIGTFSTVM